MTTASLYDAVVTHTRLQPIRRGFRHSVYLWLVDLDDLPRLPWYLQPLARFSARDHLGDPTRSIRENLDSWLASHGIDLGGGQVLMLANARVLGYVFNPLTVYWCHDSAGELVCVVAEVHNTYGERHCYLLRPDPAGHVTAAKEFYVSPFFTVQGDYRMRFGKPGKKLDITIVLRQAGKPTFTATLRGTSHPATAGRITRTVLRRPLMPQRVSALIFRHGLVLWLRRLPVIKRSRHVSQEGVQ